MYKPMNKRSSLVAVIAVGSLLNLFVAVALNTQFNYPLTMSALNSPLASPIKYVEDRDEGLGITTNTKTRDAITYTLVLSGVSVNTTAQVTDTVASNGSVIPGSAVASSSPAPSINGNTVTWSGTVPAGQLVTITFRVELTSTLVVTQLVNGFTIGNDSSLNTSNLVTTTIEPYQAYLPIVKAPPYRLYMPVVIHDYIHRFYFPVAYQ
jgi:hypothetical protein